MSYGKVHDVYWEDDKIESLSDHAALLGLFLITGPHRNAIGCFRLGMGAITDIPRFGGWGVEGVSKALFELSEIGFIVHDDKTGWTFITNALKHDPIISPKGAIHALSLVVRVPKNTAVYQSVIAKLEPQLKAYDKALSGKPGWPIQSPIEGASKGHDKPQRSPLPLPEPLPAPSRPTEDADGCAALTPKEEAKRRLDVGHRVVELLGLDPAKWTGDFSIISAWLNAGYGPELDIFPTAERIAKRRGAGAVKSLTYLTQAIADAKTARDSGVPAGGGSAAAPPNGSDGPKLHVTTNRDRWLDSAIAKLAGVGYSAPEIKAMKAYDHAEDDAWLQARIAEKTDLTKRPECMAGAAVNDRMDA